MNKIGYHDAEPARIIGPVFRMGGQGSTMACYLVSAKLKDDALPELEHKLRNGIIAHLKPFGQTLTRGLMDARIDADGLVQWEEEDYCVPPLKLERRQVLDRYFTNITTEAVAHGEGRRRIGHLPLLFPGITDDERGNA